MHLFLITFITLLFYMNFLIGKFYVSAFAITGTKAIVFWTLHFLLTSTLVAAPYVYRKYPVKNPGRPYNALQWIGYIAFGIYSVLLILMFVDQLGLFAYSHLSSPDEQKYLTMKTAVAFLTLIVTFFTTIIGFFEARKKPEIKRVEIPLKNLPDQFQGISILQMSDIHVGQTIRKSFVEKLVNMSNEIAPDIVVLTGDLVDGVYDQLSTELEPFKEIKARLGKYMVPGNHEYYWGVNEWIQHWKEIGFTTLLNEHSIVEIESSQLVIAGVHDYSARRMGGKHVSSPAEAVKSAPLDAIRILLAHQPRSIYEAHKAGFHLQISGHTHSGQYFPYNLLIYLFQPFVKGLNRYQSTWIYVNQGTGYWGPPSRFGVPPEMTLFILKKEADV